MSPIPPPEQKSPIQKAIEKMVEEAAKYSAPTPTAVIVHPKDGPLVEAWRKQVELLKNNPPPLTAGPGLPITYKQAVSWDEQHTMDRTELGQQLEDSLWARATYHTPAFTRDDLYKHVGPGHMEDDWYVKRVYPDEVHLLCKCQTILVMARCRYDWEDESGQMRQCEELAFPQEATLRKDTRCGQHMGTQKGKA
jgi:hypothetical protein